MKKLILAAILFFSIGAISCSQSMKEPKSKADIVKNISETYLDAHGYYNSINIYGYLHCNKGIKVLEKTDSYPQNSSDGLIVFKNNLIKGDYSIEFNRKKGIRYYYSAFCTNNNLTYTYQVTAIVLDFHFSAKNDFYHLIGEGTYNSSSWKTKFSGETGWLMYGPYKRNIPAGKNVVSFYVYGVAANNTNGDDVVAILDINDYDGGKILAKRAIKASELTSYSKKFELIFNNYVPGNRLELRVLAQGKADLKIVSVGIASLRNLNKVTSFESEDYYSKHQIGFQDGNYWSTNNSSGSGFMVYGPYTDSIPNGFCNAIFTLKRSYKNFNSHYLTLDIYNSSSGQIIRQKKIIYDMPYENNDTRVSIPFFNNNPNNKLEFRTQYHTSENPWFQNPQVWQDRVEIYCHKRTNSF